MESLKTCCLKAIPSYILNIFGKFLNDKFDQNTCESSDLEEKVAGTYNNSYITTAIIKHYLKICKGFFILSNKTFVSIHSTEKGIIVREYSNSPLSELIFDQKNLGYIFNYLKHYGKLLQWNSEYLYYDSNTIYEIYGNKNRLHITECDNQSKITTYDYQNSNIYRYKTKFYFIFLETRIYDAVEKGENPVHYVT